MLRIIKITGRTGRFDVPSFLLTENEGVTLKIETKELRQGKFVLTVKHGTQSKTVYLGKQMTVDLSPEWLKGGGAEPILFSLEFRDMTASIVYTRYEIEPLEVKEMEVGAEYLSMIQTLEIEVAKLRERVQGQEDVLRQHDETLLQIPQKIEQAKREAVIEANDGDPLKA